MNPQITVTITGPQGSGKIFVSDIIQSLLENYRSSNQPLGDDLPSRVPSVRIVERTDAPYQGNPAHRFTPGPYKVRPFRVSEDSMYGQQGLTSYTIHEPGEDLCIATIISDCIDEHQENAVLLSRAPVLLERCEAAERMITNLITDIRSGKLIHQHAADNLELHRDHLRREIARATTVQP